MDVGVVLRPAWATALPPHRGRARVQCSSSSSGCWVPKLLSFEIGIQSDPLMLLLNMDDFFFTSSFSFKEIGLSS